MLSSPEKIARVLRSDKDNIFNIEKRLAEITGKKGVMTKIWEENHALIKDRLHAVGITGKAGAGEIYRALLSKANLDDKRFFETLGRPDCRQPSGIQPAIDAAKKIVNPPKGYFMKMEKAREFLMKEPPKRVMEFLGYDTIEKMLEKEDLMELYASLRFIEGSKWLNEVFFKQYNSLTPDDFEEREIQVRALSEKWGKGTEDFVMKKRHNVSHLKEIGVVFVIPVMLGIEGEVLRMFALVTHYLYEIPFYSDMFRRVAGDRMTFTRNFTSLLRGDLVDHNVAGPLEDGKSLWFVVQRYLAKDDENDWRLFAPHINPEALHWEKAEDCLEKVGSGNEVFAKELSFWQDLGWVGDYFKDDAGVEILVSFNLVDMVMSFVKEKEMIKYLYHHQEALWNKIFEEYMGREQLDKYSRDYLLQGYFEI